ncbi:MAG: hypothetical protein GF329_06145 [Candidatus Lokiarchaeota archaeon]|nr:hypothetical protein [Candidatus Lokiarchaeota archaeon]
MYSKIAKNIILPSYQFIIGGMIHKNLKYYEYTQHLSSSDIKELQWMKVKKILTHAYNTVPFYHTIFKKNEITPDDISCPEDFIKIPLLAKESIRENIDRIISNTYKKQSLLIGSTGGSTGSNLNFYYDRNSVDYREAITYRNDQWAGLNIGDKYVKLWGAQSGVTLSKTMRGRLYNKLFRQLLLSSYNLTKESMNEYSKKIINYKPKCIIGYSSALSIFAEFLKNNHINKINPYSIISSAEVLYEYQRRIIESIFHCPVFNRYGCREVGTIAQECSEHNGLHINAEHVYVEVINRNGELCKPGEKGEIVITDLDNYGFPFIRYKIEDLGILSPHQCKCAIELPLLEKVEGRIFDIIVGTNGNHITGTFWTILFRTAVAGIEKFQVIQKKLGTIQIKLVVNDSFTLTKRKKLIQQIQKKCGEDTEVIIDIVKKIPLTPSGKHRYIISEVSPFTKLSK